VEVENGMQKKSLTAMVRHHLGHARNSPDDRSAETIYGEHEHVMRQTVIAPAELVPEGATTSVAGPAAASSVPPTG
jgi:hypothetical protein